MVPRVSTASALEQHSDFELCISFFLILMDIDTTLPVSLLDSDDSDDAVNSSSAKVYFGPILSPEKKFVSKFNQPAAFSIDTRPNIALFSTNTHTLSNQVLGAPSTPKASKNNSRSQYLPEDGLYILSDFEMVSEHSRLQSLRPF